MNYLLIPDLLAMAFLVGALLTVNPSHAPRGHMRLWRTALMLILSECAARMVYTMENTSRLTHSLAHAAALNCYLIAGVVFLLSASPFFNTPRGRVAVWLNALPCVALLTYYGMDLRSAPAYDAIGLLGVLCAAASCVFLRPGMGFRLRLAAIWAPILWAIFRHEYRGAAYVSLAIVYALCALGFARSLDQGSRGKIAVVIGFTQWSLCFLTHPWIAASHPAWSDFFNEVWNMQKFLISVGLVLVLLERQLKNSEWLALHDELCGLPNRRLFDDRLQHALVLGERAGQRIALFHLDLDGFKNINDTFGHGAGDILLRGVARQLDAAIRRSDTLARLGGDEFALLAVDLGPDERHADGLTHLAITERIFSMLTRVVEQPICLGPDYRDQVVAVSASIGVAIFPDDGRDAAVLMQLADKRMYQEKEERTAGRKGKPLAAAQSLLSNLRAI